MNAMSKSRTACKGSRPALSRTTCIIEIGRTCATARCLVGGGGGEGSGSGMVVRKSSVRMSSAGNTARKFIVRYHCNETYFVVT